MSLTTVVPVFLLALASLSSAYCPGLIANGVNFKAAECIFVDGKCSNVMSRLAGRTCSPGIPAVRQTWFCRAQACAYCKCNPYVTICKSNYWRKVCTLSNGIPRKPGAWRAARPWSVPRPKLRFTSNTGSCVRRGINGHVSIPVAYTKKAWAPWARARGGQCLIWKPNKKSHSIDPPGSGTVCYEFTVDRASHYYFTMISMAPDYVDYNDAWVSFPTGGLRLYKAATGKYRGWYSRNWMKAYQNKGLNQYENQILSVDFDGHQFETPKLYPGRKYKICIAGRSSKFTICKLHFVACFKQTCANWNTKIQYAINRRASSPCV